MRVHSSPVDGEHGHQSLPPTSGLRLGCVRGKEYGAVDVGADEKAGGLVIGSNGGGLSCVTSPAE
ncbi:hypothetical protein ABT187_33490 [Streptomyces sp. NPDC001817]|uniref:hypothetical protein n=1 Tax=Streptomyces sp. NPDC001817 TaxID=3154398 RepID=UPI0033308856